MKYPSRGLYIICKAWGRGNSSTQALNFMDFVELCSSQSRVGNVPGAKELHLICLKWSRLPLLSFLLMEMQPGDYRFQQATLQRAKQPRRCAETALHAASQPRGRGLRYAVRGTVTPGWKKDTNLILVTLNWTLNILLFAFLLL